MQEGLASWEAVVAAIGQGPHKKAASRTEGQNLCTLATPERRQEEEGLPGLDAAVDAVQLAEGANAREQEGSV